MNNPFILSNKIELVSFEKDKPPGRVSGRIRSLFLLRSCKTLDCNVTGEEREGSGLEQPHVLHINVEAQL